MALGTVNQRDSGTRKIGTCDLFLPTHRTNPKHSNVLSLRAALCNGDCDRTPRLVAKEICYIGINTCSKFTVVSNLTLKPLHRAIECLDKSLDLNHACRSCVLCQNRVIWSVAVPPLIDNHLRLPVARQI